MNKPTPEQIRAALRNGSNPDRPKRAAAKINYVRQQRPGVTKQWINLYARLAGAGRVTS